MHQAPEWAYFTKPANWGMSELQQREAIRAYYAAIAFMDAQVGKLLDALDRLELADNTTIVFWGDNGYQLGEHGQWMKQTVFEWAARIPLLIGGAGVKARGTRVPRTVELLDLYPTLADVCGLQSTRRRNLQGRSLRPLLDNADARLGQAGRQPDEPRRGDRRTRRRRDPGGAGEAASRSRLLAAHRALSLLGVGARTASRVGEELYDYQADPREVRNLTDDLPPQHQGALAAPTRRHSPLTPAAPGVGR